jgi:rare lipoprotein A
MRNKLQKICCSIFMLLFLLLPGCSTTHHYGRDCAPDFNIDVSKIPDAVPKAEPLSKYGNPPSYVVDGHRYYVMKSSIGYDEKGIASWYGMKFYKVRTSNRELYNVAGMTAAHRTLPLPTYVLVTNLKNGKHVIVKVNDRGPFVANRLIDLSYVAAVKLGVTAHGTALVEVKAIDPLHPERVLGGVCSTPSTCSATPPVSIPHKPQLYLQMGAFSQRANAEQLANKVKACLPYPVNINSTLKHDQTLYRVQIGPVPNVQTTDDIYDKLKKAGLGKPTAVVN